MKQEKIKYIKDKEIKTLEGKCFSRLMPDRYINKNGKHFFLEYENSSRGMVSHMAKYINYCHKNPEFFIHLLFVESEKHALQHRPDIEKSMLIYEITKDKVPNLKITFKKCNGSLNDLKKMWFDFFSS